jgi:hypothetical protein
MKQFVLLFGNRKLPFSVLVVSVALCFSRSLVEASSVTLVWNPSSDSTVTRYRIYYGESRGLYTQWLDVGNVTNATVSGLADGVTYFFAACSYNSASVASVLSNEVEYTTPTSAGNRAPIASNSSYVGLEDQSVSVVLNASDPDGNPLNYILVTLPAHGVLTGTAPNLTYSPAVNYNGTDQLSFKVNDGQLESAIATVSISVSPVNDPPTAMNASFAVTAGATVNITLGASDVDGDALTYRVAGAPAHGSLTGIAPNLTYLPATNFNGTDAFTFNVSDAQSQSALATVSITIAPVNHSPTAAAGSLMVAEDSTAGVTLTGSDVDGDSLSYTVVSAPIHGTLTGTAPGLLYRPQSNYFGPDAFTFKVSDGKSESPVATVSITVTSVNDAPVGQSRNVNVLANTPASIALIGSDADGDPLSYEVASLPAHGTLTGQPPLLTYTPQWNYWGSDSLAFTVRDGQASSAPATISISVKKNNSPPNGRGKKVNTAQGTPLAISLEADDPDWDSVTYQVVSAPANGSLSGETPNLIYTPTPEFTGEDRIVFLVNDGIADSTPTVVSIAVVPRDLMPQFTRVFVNTSGVHLTSTAVVGKTYRLKSREGFGSTTWIDVGEALVANSTRMNWVDTRATAAVARFYVVELVDP